MAIESISTGKKSKEAKTHVKLPDKPKPKNVKPKMKVDLKDAKAN